MSDSADSKQKHADDLYEEEGVWHVNVDAGTVFAKRMPGKYRTIKWFTMSTWLIFFLGPYLRWGDRQAVLFDIPDRQFHIFDITILPQDVWLLSLTLLFFAILLAVVTLTHDVGVIPLNIRFNLVECNGGPVGRIADDSGKTSCEDPKHLASLKEVFGIDG